MLNTIYRLTLTRISVLQELAGQLPNVLRIGNPPSFLPSLFLDSCQLRQQTIK